MKPSEAQQIVQDYAAVLGESVATGVLRDINSLPCSKDEIKAALRFALGVTSDPVMRGHLKTAYISLADFQELSDEEIKALQIWNRMVGSSTNTMTAAETRNAAAAISNVGQVVTSLQSRTTAEAEALLEELKAAGF